MANLPPLALPVYMRIGDGPEHQIGTIELAPEVSGTEVVIKTAGALGSVADELKWLARTSS
jgi:hypothetical protein